MHLLSQFARKMLQITHFCGERFLAWKSGSLKFWTISCLTLTGPCNAQNSAKMFLSQRLHLLVVQQSTQALHSNHYQLLTDDFHILYCQTARLPNPTLYTGYWERFHRPNGFLAQNLAALFSAIWHHCYCAMNSLTGAAQQAVALQVLSQALTDDVKCQALGTCTQSVRSSNLNVAKS